MADMKLPRMLFGKILRSPYPHARILNIDTSKARKATGVKAVITANDTPKLKFSLHPPLRADKMPLEEFKVRYVGDEVAAVAAADENTAQEAISLIEVDYELLPAVFDPEEAMKPEAPKIHDDESNVASYLVRQFGDVGLGFKEADRIFENRFSTSRVTHCCMETHGCIAFFLASGRLTVWSTTQTPNFLYKEIARALGIASRMVKVIKPFVGGAFGGRRGMDMQDAICALLSMKTGRPVKICNTREEEFTTSRLRYPMVIKLKTGVKKDGTLLARQATVITDNGAYNYKGPAITGAAGLRLDLMYKVPNTKFEGYVVYTNNQYGGAFRGFGSPQITFAIESEMDMIAEDLGIDPLEMRLKNSYSAGYQTISGAKITSCGLQECIKKGAELARWREKRGRRDGRGIGMATLVHTGGGTKDYGYNCSEAFVRLNDDCTVSLISGASDTGQGSDTILAQIVAETLGVGVEDIEVITGDSDICPLDLGAWGSRQTFTSGNAARIAAEEARRQLLEIASEMLEANPGDLDIRAKKVFVKETPDRKLSMAEVLAQSYSKKGRPVAARGFFDEQISTNRDLHTGFSNPFPAYAFGAHFAEVEVDRETGEIRVLNIVAAHDLGRAINPMAAEGQIEGAVAQGLGTGMTEYLVWEEGQTINPTFIEYKIPSAIDMPNVKPILVESIDPNGPFGAKGVGEPGLVPTAPAIANAIYDAVGVRIKDLPLTSEKVLNALRELKNGKEEALI